MKPYHLRNFAQSAIIGLLLLSPSALLAQAGNCGQFTDVPASSIFCGNVLQAFYTGITQGTSATTFSPNDLVPREQTVAFFTRTMDQTLRRANPKIAAGKTWSPNASSKAQSPDLGLGINDIISDGTFLWAAVRNGNRILKINAADRRIVETWSLAKAASRLGYFAGNIWAVDGSGALYTFDPAGTPGTGIGPLLGDIGTGWPSVAFDGTTIFYSNSDISLIWRYVPGSPTASGFDAGSNVMSMIFDGRNLWTLHQNRQLHKRDGSGAILESITLAPGAGGDGRMVFDGTNIWIPQGNLGVVVVRPTQTSAPSVVLKSEGVPGVAFPYAASFDGEYVMIGGLNNGAVALYKASDLSYIRTFASGAANIRGIASNGLSFNVADYNGSRFFQF